MKRVLLAATGVLFLAVLTPPAWADTQGADLAVTVAWAGPGRPHLHSGDHAVWTATVTNLGPGTAQQVEVGAGGSDQFRAFGASCDPTQSSCALGDLAVGESRTVTFSAQGCLVQTESRRVWWVSSSVGSSTADPDPSNNQASVDVRLTGALGSCRVR